MPGKRYEVEYTDEFEAWWNGLRERAQDEIDKRVRQLELAGPALKRPIVGKIEASKHAHMKELRAKTADEVLRVIFAFDPRTHAILLIGGDKTNDPGFYDRMIPIADKLYDEHLRQLREEGLTDG